MNQTVKIKLRSDSEVLTVVQTLNFDLVEVQRGGHADVERTLGDGVSSVTHSDGHVPLMDTDYSEHHFINQLSYMNQDWESSDLLHRRVADGVRVVVVIDDLKVSDRLAFSCSGEVNLRFGFPGSFCVNSEVSRFSHFNTCTESKNNTVQYS